MATATIYPDIDNSIESANAVYATARSGGTKTVRVTTVQVGQATGYNCYEGAYVFDTSMLGHGGVVTAAALSLWLSTDNSVTDFLINAKYVNFGQGPFATGDWVSGADAANLTTIGSLNTNGIGATGAYKTLTITDFSGFMNNPGAGENLTSTGILLSSSRFEGNNTPAGNEYVVFLGIENAGTTNDPYASITYAYGLDSLGFDADDTFWGAPVTTAGMNQHVILDADGWLPTEHKELTNRRQLKGMNT